MPRAGETEITSGASALPDHDPVASAYRLLGDAVSRYGLRDAWLVVHPRGRCAQIFRHGGRPTDGADVRRLAARPTGLYGDPAIDPVAGALLGASYEATFTAQHAAADAMVDPQTGLMTRRAIDRSLARAAASAARHRWSTTAVLVTTAGAREAVRWPALAAALGEALRSGDEAGTVEPGTGLALLGNAGADAVHPFLARVRAALSAAGWEDADLLAGAATTPQESVDPAELWRLASERLAALGADPPAMGSASPLELELRQLPAVACVGLHQNGSGPAVTVVRLGPAAAGDIEATVRRHDPDLAVHVVTADTPSATATGEGGDGGPDPQAGGDAEATDDSLTPFDPPSPPPPAAPPSPETGPPAAPTATAMPHDGPPAGDPALARSAAAPGTGGDPAYAPRTTLVGATFNPSRGMSEVTLALGPVRQTGRAPAGALIGGAQATLVALGALGRSIPFYLVSAERVRTIPGEPVVVVLAPRDDAGPAGPAGNCIGVAGGTTDVEAASKAVLAALNRFLAGFPSGA